MKLKKDNQISYQTNTVFEGQDASIDAESMDKLFDLLQDPYKNPIGAVVREYTSNAFDSHSEAAFVKANSISDIRTEFSDYLNYSDEDILKLKKQLDVFDDDAVIVTVGKDDSGAFWAVEDFGIGLSDHRVKNIFTSYLKSTKESSDNVIGAFGIGSKSGLSYNDVVHIRSRYNGVERVYMLRKGERRPRLDFITEEPTTERNGTQIKIYIKTVTEYAWREPTSEYNRFIEECEKQLAYFDNVFFTGSYASSLPTTYNIFRGKNWIKHSTITPFKGLHLCLGKVAYPIDWDNLGIDPIRCDVALRFEIGELDIIQTREDLKYTPRTKKALLEKIEAFKEEVKDNWLEENNQGILDDFYKYLYRRDNNDITTFKFSNHGDVKLQLGSIFNKDEMSDFTLEYEPFKKLGFDSSFVTPSLFFNDFEIPNSVDHISLKHRPENVWSTLVNYPERIYRIEGNHEARKSKYIVHELTKSSIYFLRKKKPKLINYVKYLRLNKYPKDEWRGIIQAVQKAVKGVIFDKTKSYKNVEVDKEWIKSFYKQRGSVDRSLFNTYDIRYNDINKVRKDRVYKEFGSKLCVYGTKEDKYELERVLDTLKTIFDNKGIYKPVFKVFHLGKTNFKYVENLPNAFNIKEMMKHKLFIKYCTAKYILGNSIFSRFNEFKQISNLIYNINKDVGEDCLRIYKFLKHYYNYVSNDAFLQSVYEYVLENNLFDQDMVNTSEKINNYFKHIEIIRHVYIGYITHEDLLVLIHRVNKGLPLEKRKKIDPVYHMKLTEEEESWIEGTKELELYKQLNLID